MPQDCEALCRPECQEDPTVRDLLLWSREASVAAVLSSPGVAA